jgi:hypothetical protein
MSPAWASRAALALGLLALAAAFGMTSGRLEWILLWAALAPAAVGLWRLRARRARPGARISLSEVQAPAEGGGAARAGGCMGCLALFLGGSVLLSLPALLASRAAHNMSLTRQSLRRITEVEVRKAEANGGLWVPLERLSLPETSLPQRSGYRFSFHAVPASAEEIRAAGAAAGSLKAWAYSAVPGRPPSGWAPTGLYAFCADSQGVFCRTASGAGPAVDQGRCPPPKDESLSGDSECGSGGSP